MRTCRAVVVAATAVVLAAVVPAAHARPNCPECGRELADSFRFCPFDGTALPQNRTCTACARPMDAQWRFCPYDGTRLERTGERTAPVGPPAAGQPPSSPAPAGAVAPGAAGAAAVARGPAGTAAAPAGNPLDTVEALLEAVREGEATRIRGLYDWERFFAEQDERRAAAAGEPAAGPRTPAGPAELEARIAAYIQRLLERVRPTLAQTRHRVTDVKLDRSSARLRVEIRRRDTAELVQSYDFSLAHTPNGWRIVHIAP